MKHIKVLGSGCKKCRTTADVIAQAAERLGVAITLEKVEGYADIAAYGVMATPSVVIDEAVVHTGSVPNAKTIAGWLQ